MKTFAVIFALFTAIGLLSVSAVQKRDLPVVNNLFTEPIHELHSGDMVLRSGKGFISDMFRKFNQSGAPWSHAGILIWENSEWQVYHIMGDAGDSLSRIRKEPLRSFCNSHSNNGYAIYRNSGIVQNETVIKSYLDSLSDIAVRFDHHFNLKDDGFMYCTELVYKTMLRAGFDNIPLSQLEGENYVAIDNLYRHSNISKITEIHY
jgi:hypothetical protein